MVDDADADAVRNLRALSVNAGGYATYLTGFGRNGTKRKYLHALIAGHEGMSRCVDHINGNKLDNRRGNLRIVTQRENQVNRHKLNKNNRTGVRGISFNAECTRRPWKATLTVNYRTVNIGQFATKDEAVAARRAAEPIYFGESCPEVSA